MKLKVSRLPTWLFFILSVGLVILNQFAAFKVAVLYGIIPLVFFSILLIERQLVLNSKPLNQYVYFFAWSTVSLVYTLNFEMTVSYLFTLLGNIVLWYCVYRLVFLAKNVNVLLWFFLILFLYHAFQAIITPTSLDAKFIYRATGLFTNSNALGFAMWYGIITSLALMVLNSNKRLIQWILGLGLILFFYVLMASGSRKNAFAVALSILVIIYFLGHTRYRWSVIGLGILSVVAYISFGQSIVQQSVLGARLEANELSKGGKIRSELLTEGAEMFASSPIWGIGLGSFTSYSSSGLMAHNDYVEVMASTGLIGALLYLPIYWIFYRQVKLLMKNSKTFYFGVIALAFLFGFLLLSMGRPSFLDPMAILVLALFYSIVLKKLKEIKPLYAHLPGN